MNKSTVGELIIDDESCQYGLGLPAEEYAPNKVRYLRISDIDDSGNLLDNDKKFISAPNIKDYILKPNDLVVARTGNSTGRTYVYSEDDEKLAYAGFLIKYVFNSEKINPRYMKYFTVSDFYKKQISGFSGSTRGNMNAQNFKNITVIYPNRKNQDKMVELFDLISKKIKNNNKIISELESLAKTIYDYWFLQFEFPNEDGKPYKSSGGMMVWNKELNREIPKGWEAKKIDDIVILLKDGTHNPPKRINHGIPLLTGTMFGKNFLDYSGATYISNDDFQKIHSKYAPESGDIVMTKIGTIGNVNMLCENDIPIAIHCNSALFRFPREIQGMYPLQMLKSQEFQARIDNNKGQSIQEFLSLSKLGSIPVIVPQEQTIKNFNTLTSPFLEKMGSIREENKTLQSLRDFLLPMLMNGQVTFKEEL